MRNLIRKLVAPAAVAAAILLSLAGPAKAATPECNSVAGGACSSWQTPVAGGVNLDVFQQRTASGTPIIIYTPGNDPAEDFTVVPVAKGSVSVYSYAGVVQSPGLAAPAAGTWVNLVYTPKGVNSGMCVSDIAPIQGVDAQLRPCANVAGEYNPFQTFDEVAYSNGDGLKFVYFEDAPVDQTALNTPTSEFLAAGRTDMGIGSKGHRISVLSALDQNPPGAIGEPTPSPSASTSPLPFNQELWASVG